MATQVAAPPVEAQAVDPVAALATAFTAITDAIEAHKTNGSALTSAQESETRAVEAVNAAKVRTTSAKANAALQASAVTDAIDVATEALSAVRVQFVA